jgi:phage-related baseplate assembly protein
MAGSFTSVDLAQLPPPQVVEELSFESIFQDMLADLRARDPAFTALVGSDPAYKILQVAAYRELLIRQRVNDGARSVMLAYAGGADLDQLAANYNVQRLVIQAGDPDAIPPTEDVMESDADFRRRILLSQEGYTTAGSIGAYTFHALSASGDCLDVSVANPAIAPGRVDIAVLSRTGTGAAPAATLDAVRAALSAETVRPLCDSVQVESANIVAYSIAGTLTMYPGAGKDRVLARAQAAAEAYAAKMHALGIDVTRSGIFAALHQAGVQNVRLDSPPADVVVRWNEASSCTGILLTIGGEDE